MSELLKIYDRWAEEQPRNEKLSKSWKKLMDYLYKHSSENDREAIADLVVEYSMALEQQGFFFGFGIAFRLCNEIPEKDHFTGCSF